MRVDAKVLRKFFKAVPSFVNDGLFVVKENNEIGATLTAVDVEQTCLVSCKLFKRVIGEYNELGEMGIQDIQLVEKILGRFPREVTLAHNENVLLIYDNDREACIATADPEYITKPSVGEDKFKEFDVVLAQQRDTLVNAISNARTIGADMFVLKIENGYFTISAQSGENILKEKRRVDVDTKVEVTLPDTFKKVVSSIPTDCEVKISLSNDMPVRIDALSADMKITYIVTPMIVTE